jgi:succinyl-diaminopimelate desuccinylase
MHCGSEGALLEQLRALVRIPSQAGIDPYPPILQAVLEALRAYDVDARLLHGAQGDAIGIWGMIRGGRPGPTFMLNATVDTAPFGDPEAWRRTPTSAHIEDGWLYGRGSADSKAGVVVFSQLAAVLSRETHRLRGTMLFLFDADEHSGAFGGIRRFVSEHPELLPSGGVMIGYPGHERIIIGCRGFMRAALEVHGVSAHSGSSSRRGVNAIGRAARLVRQLEAIDLAHDPHDAFRLPPQLTVTSIHGGEGFSSVPDRCRVQVDIRLTPAFAEDRARDLLQDVVAPFDSDRDAAAPTGVEVLPGWPAYRLPDDAPVYQALRAAAASVIGRELPGDVAGPSSIGNYLATLGIQATSGFGVHYRGVHSADECIDISTLEPTFRTYLEAARLLLR